MAQGCQRLWVALAGQDRADDAQAGGAGDVGDDVVELKILLRQGLCICWMCEAAYSSRRSR